VRLWSAHTGKVYSREESDLPLASCPLTTVSCVFDDSNVWANVQPENRLYDMDWHLHDNPKCWRPFFGPRGYPQPKTVQSVQAETLVYRKSTDEIRSNLEREVEDRLQREFEDLRGHRQTDWNRSLANTLRKLLKRFEEDISGGQRLTKEEHEAQLDRVRATYHIVGFPLNHSMVEAADMRPLILQLRHTSLWLSESPKIQFALCAYCHPYPNAIFSVWVYVAALHDQRAAATGA